MFDVDKFLDRAKAGAGVDSDYALAKATGIGKGNISNYRLGKSSPDERAILALCRFSGDDPEDVAVRLQAMRAANDDAAGLWRRVAERLKGGANVIVIAVLALAYSTPFQREGADAAPLDGVSEFAVVCILCQIVWKLIQWARATLRLRPPKTS